MAGITYMESKESMRDGLAAVSGSDEDMMRWISDRCRQEYLTTIVRASVYKNVVPIRNDVFRAYFLDDPRRPVAMKAAIGVLAPYDGQGSRTFTWEGRVMARYARMWAAKRLSYRRWNHLLSTVQLYIHHCREYPAYIKLASELSEIAYKVGIRKPRPWFRRDYGSPGHCPSFLDARRFLEMEKFLSMKRTPAVAAGRYRSRQCLTCGIPCGAYYCSASCTDEATKERYLKAKEKKKQDNKRDRDRTLRLQALKELGFLP